ncbi:MAG: hypothetical protein JWO31_1666, partial [Phycisphaerales bacterium]|nr:hypothetical protein [Phycisphaerales bacterium]
MKPPARSPNPAAFPLPLPRPGWAALPLAPAGPPEPPLWTIDDHLAAAERQMDGLRHEMDALRRRDATVHHAMRRLDEELRLAA